MTSPLVYVFAVAACLLALWFLIAALLALSHARERPRRADELAEYIAAIRSGAVRTRVDGGDAVARRARVLQITIGDLVRDDAIADATARGISKLRNGPRKPPPDAAS